MPDLAKPGGHKLILVFLEKKGYKKDSLDRRRLANRRYEAIARRPGQTLQDFFATENTACAEAVEAGVGIDPDRRAYHMFIMSGLTDDQINHIYGFSVRIRGGRTRGSSGSSKGSGSCAQVL